MASVQFQRDASSGAVFMAMAQPVAKGYSVTSQLTSKYMNRLALRNRPIHNRSHQLLATFITQSITATHLAKMNRLSSLTPNKLEPISQNLAQVAPLLFVAQAATKILHNYATSHICWANCAVKSGASTLTQLRKVS
jgi:hypothetical protein